MPAHHFATVKRFPLFSFPQAWNNEENTRKSNPSPHVYCRQLKAALLASLAEWIETKWNSNNICCHNAMFISLCASPHPLPPTPPHPPIPSLWAVLIQFYLFKLYIATKLGLDPIWVPWLKHNHRLNQAYPSLPAILPIILHTSNALSWALINLDQEIIN